MAVFYYKSDERNRNKQTPLTVQRLVAAQREDANCRHLVVKGGAPNSTFLYDEVAVL